MARLAHLLVTVVKGHLLLTPLVITVVLMLFILLTISIKILTCYYVLGMVQHTEILISNINVSRKLK